MQYLKIILTGKAKAAISGLSFSSHAYYPAWNVPLKKFGRPNVTAESQLKKIYRNPPIRQDDSSNIVRFSNVVTNTVYVLNRLGFQYDLGSEVFLSSATRKLSPQLNEQSLRHLQDHRLLAANLIVFKDWLESTAFMQEDLLAQTNSKFQSREKPETSAFSSNADDSTKPKNSECPFKDGQHAVWGCEKFKSRKLNERREHVQKFILCFNCLRPGHRSKDCKSRT